LAANDGRDSFKKTAVKPPYVIIAPETPDSRLVEIQSAVASKRRWRRPANEKAIRVTRLSGGERTGLERA
jgi:hypothetical protein